MLKKGGEKIMNLLVALGISIGVLVGIYGQVTVSGTLGLITWVSVISWASFYAAGGKTEGLVKATASNLSGVIWGIIIVFIAKSIPVPFALGIGLLVGAFMICVQANLKVLSFIPGAFLGCGAYFGTNFDWKHTIISLIVGGVLGYISEVIAVFLSNIGKKNIPVESSKEI